MLKLTAQIIKSDGTGFTGWIEELNGVVAQGETLEEVKAELIKILKIKLEIDLGFKRQNTVVNEYSEKDNLFTQQLTLTPEYDTAELEA